MNQLLGFLTAFFVVGWAVRWYFRQATPSSKIEWQAPKEDTVLPGATRWQTLEDTTLVEPFAEPEVVISKASEVKGEVEKRLEALVEAEEPEQDAPDTIEATATVDVADVQRDDGNTDSDPADSDEEKVIGFCARCRDKREVLNPVRTQTKKGKAAIRGNCKLCGAGMFVFVAES